MSKPIFNSIESRKVYHIAILTYALREDLVEAMALCDSDERANIIKNSLESAILQLECIEEIVKDAKNG